MVNNELGPWVAGNSAILNARRRLRATATATSSWATTSMTSRAPSDLQNHGIYADTTRRRTGNVGYNWIHDITGGNLIQFNDNEGGAGSLRVAPRRHLGGLHGHHGSTTTGSRTRPSTASTSTTRAVDEGRAPTSGQIWNNVIIGTGQPPLRINSTQPTQKLWFAFNTIYNDMTAFIGGGQRLRAPEPKAGRPSAGVQQRVLQQHLHVRPEHGRRHAVVRGRRWHRGQRQTYNFKRNLYYGGGQSPDAPDTIGDATALVGDPLFTNAAAGDFTTQAGSPARKAAIQPLPSGFSVTDDFTGRDPRTNVGPTDINASISP